MQGQWWSVSDIPVETVMSSVNPGAFQREQNPPSIVQILHSFDCVVPRLQFEKWKSFVHVALLPLHTMTAFNCRPMNRTSTTVLTIKFRPIIVGSSTITSELGNPIIFHFIHCNFSISTLACLDWFDFISKFHEHQTDQRYRSRSVVWMRGIRVSKNLYLVPDSLD